MENLIQSAATQPEVGVDNENQTSVQMADRQETVSTDSLCSSQELVKATPESAIDKGNRATPGTAVTYQRHAINKMLPGMSAEHRRTLKESIQQNGLKIPILLHEGSILDGWHRYRVCIECGVTPRFEDYNGNSPVTDCWSLNVARRHMDKSQLAALAVTFIPLLETEAKARQLSSLKQNRRRDGNKNKTDMDAIDEALPKAGKGSVRSQLSKMIGVGESYIQRAKNLSETDPSLFEKVREGAMTMSEAKAAVYRQTEAEKKNTDSIVIRDNNARCSVHNCDLLAAPIEDGSLDAIICDPPYVKENLDCWIKLASFAASKLKDGGSLLAMGGVYYLPDEMRNLTIEGLNYYWTLCYHMPDKGSLPKGRHVKCNWKPVLWYVKGKYDRTFQPTDHFSDAYENCAEGKQFHKWGQSVDFFTRLVEKFTYADELVCDPFLGGGTTAIAALSLKRRFVGVELDPEAYQVSMKRIQDWKPNVVSVDFTETPKSEEAIPAAQDPEMKLAA